MSKLRKRNYRPWRIIFFWASMLVALLSTIACVVPTMHLLPLGSGDIWRVLGVVIAGIVAFAVRLLSLILGQAFWTWEGFALMAQLNAAEPITTWVNLVFWALFLITIVFGMLHSASERDNDYDAEILCFSIAACILSLIGTFGCIYPMMDYLEMEELLGFAVSACVAAAVRFLSLLLGQAFWSFGGIPIVSYLSAAKPISPFLNVLFYLCVFFILYFVVKNLMYNAMPHESRRMVYSPDNHERYYAGPVRLRSTDTSSSDPMFAGLPQEVNDELDDVTAAMNATYGEGWGNDL